MSFPRIVHISGQVLGDTKLSPTAKLVAAYLDAQACLAGGHGLWVRPKQQHIADALSVTRETVNRAIKQLVTLGHVKCRDVTSAARGRVGLEYCVTFDREPDAAAAPVESAVKPDVIKSSQQKSQPNQPMCASDHIGNGADVILRSHQTPDVTGKSQKEIPPTPPK